MDYKKRIEAAKEQLKAADAVEYKLPDSAHAIRTAIYAIFPELKESEDERIRKELLDHCIDKAKKYNNDPKYRNISAWIAWLEKQGQEPRKVSIWKHWKDGICGNGEGKLIYLIKVGDDYSLSSSLGFECDYIELSELDNLMLEKQCNFTDEEMKEALRTEYEKGRADAFAEMRVAWSEEDEEMLENIIDDYDDVEEHNLCDDIGKVMWLKSLKERYTWKPSEEQMGVIEAVINNRSFQRRHLDSLYADLKKLKE